jgi:ABC-type dipeptide/oligopeptide/nickel transport system permease subunit
MLGCGLSAITMRLTRTMMLEVLRQDYIRTAWAKGLPERLVVARHALRNALVPVVTLIGLQAPLLIGGAVIIEQIFVIPGMGLLLLDAVQPARLPDHHRRVPDRRRGGDAHQPGCRPELRPARPQGEVPLMASVAETTAVAAAASQARPPGAALHGRLFRDKPLGAAGAVVLHAVPVLRDLRRRAGALRLERDRAARPAEAAVAGHWFGTDNLGRDMLSRCIYGAQLSVIIGCCAAAWPPDLGAGRHRQRLSSAASSTSCCSASSTPG